MKLTTKLLKQMIAEEMNNKVPLKEGYKEEEGEFQNMVFTFAQKYNLDRATMLGIINTALTELPSEPEQQLSEGMENITPENIMLVIDALQQMGVEFAPALAGGGLMAVAAKAKDMLSGEEVMDDPQYYNDEEEIEESLADIIMGRRTKKDIEDEKKQQDTRNTRKVQAPPSSMKLQGPFEEDKK